MKRVASIAAALALACTAVAMFTGSLLAQAEGTVYDACSRDKQEVRAAALPEVLDEEKCPVAGRVIVDGDIGAVVPEPGMAVIAEAESSDGHQYLSVSNPRGGKLLIDGAGREPRPEAASGISARASGPGECRDSFYSSRDAKVYNYNRWYVNGRSIPSYLSKFRAVSAMKQGAANVTRVRDACGFGDGVRGRMIYEGATRSSVNITSNLNCTSNDYRSEVGFGDLPSSYTAFHCAWVWPKSGAPDRVAHTDIRLNKFDYRWTARVTSSCRGRQDIESSMTHERGHTFGLGEAPEGSHGNLTMSNLTNGPCQTSERSLGKGDAMGLNRKY
ncbi:hypothetical protein GBA63_08995 [Rubrobacter tropicus]|uniref:Peptidase M10 metallopeptidase domain-containing protein n=1 Tax=Rubrobacter tropicus TaxID=2653851 RepID=A0A6G8Q8J4_9ACTN|nr:hypothetical protein [Rubrobacter tropicus]QIN82769.1 hypothetical protein GBA63_08995 [Rubrobacter tropicus]